jgi:flagella basal body P-ring formation protein FlgA
MNHNIHQRTVRERAGDIAAVGAAALVCVLSAALALVWFAPAAAQEDAAGLVTPEQVLALVQHSVEETLCTGVVLEPVRELQPFALPPGVAELIVRYPKRSGYFLPDAVECRVDGRLVTSLPLGQYVRFRLSVLVAAENIPARALLDTAPVELKEQLLNAGTEVAVSTAQVAGQAARGLLPTGTRIVLSRLMRPYDVARGSQVLLVIAVDGVRLEAVATALADGYLGQRLLVERAGDRRKYTGLVCAGQRVVVE